LVHHFPDEKGHAARAIAIAVERSKEREIALTARLNAAGLERKNAPNPIKKETLECYLRSKKQIHR
jgi:hypothetical protein